MNALESSLPICYAPIYGKPVGTKAETTNIGSCPSIYPRISSTIPPDFGYHGIPQSISQKIESQHSDHDGYSRDEYQVGSGKY